jgi:hypothetical protein
LCKRTASGIRPEIRANPLTARGQRGNVRGGAKKSSADRACLLAQFAKRGTFCADGALARNLHITLQLARRI